MTRFRGIAMSVAHSIIRLRSWRTALFAIVLAVISSPSFAVSIGEVENLSESIANELQVRIADDRKYEEFGVDRPSYHSRIRLNLTRESGDRATLHLSTHRPVNEPFVAFVIEVRWPTGNLYREYTVLLDPNS